MDAKDSGISRREGDHRRSRVTADSSTLTTAVLFMKADSAVATEIRRPRAAISLPLSNQAARPSTTAVRSNTSDTIISSSRVTRAGLVKLPSRSAWPITPDR